ncbi:hypothetical protein BBK36DRAFT_19037 [Trichoderma citrinoviride]|uniref:Uncharacterized protein n=1 Tax=Trichoderma citrinoviride TaxID=58853 RepID=A0A2T4BE57_9HYPO|nr:hypothetical protein BBK36DRAFT_19037 [Trichoderma citrinoviride]PTB67531.1 hypothetical protein BBK36DRAFT_19037 [Trichoderma citrinoviride]
MAEPQEPFPGADGIRSLTDKDSIFRAFDSYPWTKDAAFLSGLRAILGPPNPSSSSQKGSLRDIATHARIFYYAQRIGVQIDFAAYQAWLAQHPDHSTPHIVPPEYEQEPSASSSPTLASPSSSSPSHSTTSPTASSAAAAAVAAAAATPWQQAAPKADLYVPRNKLSSSANSTSPSSSSEPEPAYPIAFAEMIKLLQEGKPIPGIRQIPNTIERDSTVKPVGSRPVPKKPWEREASAATEASSPFVENTLDLEFPPVEQQAATAATQS